MEKRFGIKISPSILLSGVFFALSGRIYLFICYLCALALHELAHAAVAKRLGYALERIDLGAMGAKMSLDCGIINKSDEIKIAIAGPVANFALWLAVAGVWWLFPDAYFYTADFSTANAALFIFNMLPAYPLDGGRVFFALTSKGKRAKSIGAVVSIASAAALTAVFVLKLKSGIADVTLVLAVWFVISGFIKNKDADVYRKIYDAAFRSERFKSGLPIRFFAVSEQTTVKTLKRKLSGEYFGVFRIMENGTILTETDIGKTASCDENLPVRDTKCFKMNKDSRNNAFFS